MTKKLNISPSSGDDGEMTSSMDKFCLLMWKNWLLQWRHPKQTAVEVLAPVLFSALLVLIRSLVDPETHDTPISFASFNISAPNKGLPHLYWSPKSELLTEIMEETGRSLGLWIKPYETAAVLEHDFTNPNSSQAALCGVSFHDSIANLTALPENIEVAIRFPGESRFNMPGLLPYNWRTNFLFPLYQIPGPRNPKEVDGGYPPGYNKEGFLAVQNALSRAITNSFRPDNMSFPSIQLERFPYPPYIDDPLLPMLANFIGLIIMLSFVYTCIGTVKLITTEKEKQLKEVMKIMGLPNWLHWLAWFLKTISYGLVSVSLIVLLIKVQWYPGNNVSVFTRSNAAVIFTFLILYMCTTITFCFMISVFFSKANTASTIAGLAWFMSYAPYLFLQNRYDRLNLVQKVSACLASNTAMAYGFQFMLMYEGTGEGLQWSSIWRTVTPNDDFKLGHVMIMLVVDALIYLVIALYVEAIFPGDYGVPLPWNFPFTSSYWCGLPRYIGIEDHIKCKEMDSEMYEREPTGIPAGIQIKHLRKEFYNKKVAVRNLCLNMYEGQITVLLGHNGAGKTTTMLMLTGMFPPTSGTAVVAGHDIRTDMHGVRASLGLCPQHNILFDELTVKEHIYFFSKLKGLKKNEIEEEIDKYIKLLELVPKRNSQSHTLSGGMKRKLSVCVALCGKSKIVMLDEPTAGMDPAGRRALWDLLQAEKKNRTMLLTTHFMDEADLLGDRIAIMAGGTLQCVGSSFFLKKRYGAGYHLTMEKAANCEPSKVTATLKKYIPSIHVETNVGSELTYLLTENQSPIFEKMLHDLEENSLSLGILNYGISLTTMEEVFMKVGADHGQEEENNALENNVGHENIIETSQVEMELNRQSSESRLNVGEKHVTGFNLYMNQFKAMIMKKMYSTLRSWILMLIQIIIPVSFLIVAIVVVRSWKTTKDLPNFEITLKSYVDPFTLVNNQDDTNSTADYYRAYVDNLVDAKEHVFDVKGSNITAFILNQSDVNLPLIRMKLLTGVSFMANDSIIGWFNNEAFHTTTLSLSLIHNALLRSMTNTTHEIRIFNFPLPYTLDTRIQQLSQGSNIGFQLAFNIGFSMAFVSSFYILFVIRERISKAKHLQFVSGVNVIIFWTTSYIWDMITFIITSLFLIVTLAAFQEEGFQTFEEIGRIFSVLLMFGYGMLPLIYLASFWFEIPSTGYTRMTLVNIFTGVAGFLVVEVLSTPSLGLKNIADMLDWVFLVIPHYGVSTAIRNINNINLLNNMCNMYAKQYTDNFRLALCRLKGQCCTLEEDYYAWASPGIGRNIFFFGTVGTGLFLVVLFVEYRVLERLLYRVRRLDVTKPPDPPMEDDDVTREKLRIQHLTEEELASTSLVLRDFTKYYGKFLAVNKLSVGIRRYECFGLLGVNGAGKTSTFKMLTGDEKISFGDAWVSGLSLRKDMKQVHQLIGYCPQFDALLDDLTGRETLMMFCALRGISSRDSKYVIEKMATDFDFRRHIDKKVKQYSGGNKRKLSTAVALIGDPAVVYLDEPTTGMDPAAKRQLWNALCKVRDSGKCIVLTSHSMEECEALCTRLAIMVNGTFKCLGSTQHLKSKFSEGYTLMVKVRKSDVSTGGGGGPGTTTGIEVPPADLEPIAHFVKEKFPSAVLREQYQELLTYYISDKHMSWSRMFGVMEQSKKFLNIEDYSLGQTSLEQVFLTFTKHQRTSDE